LPGFLGLDVGTQGVRAIWSDDRGQVVAEASAQFGGEVAVGGLPDGWFEQHPKVWWDTCVDVIRQTVQSARRKTSDELTAIAVDSTSGTVVPIDTNGRPLRPAIMYSDTRANAEASECNESGKTFCDELGYKFGASFGLPKTLWIARNEPAVWERTWKIIHASDYIVGRLCGEYGVSDNSNALKTGCDLRDNTWPRFIADALGIPSDRLPDLVSPGEPIGKISRRCSEQTGLTAGTLVVGGVSDGTAGFLASGATEVGEWNSTLGTTLVVRGVSESLIRDPRGRIYCHRHPDGHWLPGGAANVGGECLTVKFRGADYAALDSAALGLVPTSLFVYPLVRRGERLPFVDESAEGFVDGNAFTCDELYAAHLEGVAFMERWCYELMEELGARVGDTIHTTGGGARSIQWMTIRASVLGREVIRPSITEPAMGAALVAASRTRFDSLAEATRNMITLSASAEPERNLRERMDEKYVTFRQIMARMGYPG